MDAEPRLSVVVPSHNTRELTLRCLRSVLDIEGIALEAILVDDASKDHTVEAVEDQLPAITINVNDKNVGFTKAVNRGLADASGDLLLVLNSDTEVEAATVGRMLAAFDDDPGLGVAGAELFYPDGSPQWTAGRWPTPAWLFGLASGLPELLGRLPGYRRIKPLGAGDTGVDWVSGAAMALRRTTWEQIGPFDENYSFYCQDLDICRAAADTGWRVAIAEGFRVIHHHGSSIAAKQGSAGPANPALLWSDLLLFCAKHGGLSTAGRARRALRAGAHLRILARKLWAPAVPGPDRSRWQQETEAFSRGLKALESG